MNFWSVRFCCLKFRLNAVTDLNQIKCHYFPLSCNLHHSILSFIIVMFGSDRIYMQVFDIQNDTWWLILAPHIYMHVLKRSGLTPINILFLFLTSLCCMIFCINQAIGEDPDDAVQWHQIGLHCLCTQQFKMSQTYLKAAATRCNDSVYTWSNLGKCNF